MANRGDIDPQPLQQWCEGAFHNPEPYLETQLNGDNLLMHPQTCSQASFACAVKGSNCYTDGAVPASRYQKSEAMVHDAPVLFAINVWFRVRRLSRLGSTNLRRAWG